jgi:hypothetical protein
VGPKIEAPVKVKCRATMSAIKIHRENSLQVLSGEVPLGHTEPIEFGEPEQCVEVDYGQAVEMFGREDANRLFNKEGT